MHEIKRGERYWFEAPEEAILSETNKEFQIQVPAEQLFLQFFRAAEATEKGEKLLAVEILGRLQNKKLFNLSATKIIHFGRILSKHQIPSKRTKTGPFTMSLRNKKFPQFGVQWNAGLGGLILFY